MNLPNIDLALLQTPSLDQIQSKILLQIVILNAKNRQSSCLNG